MSRTANCIKMLQMLNSGRTIKISEFAEEFETNPRNIIEYRKELEDAGYSIITIPGKDGGYKLEKTDLIPSIKLLPQEKELVLETINYITSKKDFVKKTEFTKVFGRIASAIQLPQSTDSIKVVDHYQLSMNEKDIQERYEFIEEMIKNKNVIEIEYHSIKNGLKSHILHPYKLFLYNNSWFFLAWNPEVGDVWTFKINRIINWRKINEKFRVWKYFKPENYLNDNCLKSNGEFYRVVYLARGIRKHLAAERIYGKNQVVEDIDDDTIKVSVDIQNKELIVSYILGCGDDVEVLEPQWLIDKVKLVSKDILEKYK